MSQQSLRILSIDFDIFQNIPDIEILSAFPDGIDLSNDISCITWAGHYANNYENDLLKQVTIHQQMLNDTIHMIEKGCTKTTPTMIVNSHKHIYDWIFQYDSDNIDRFEITHLDMHHDMFNNNPELDCGNWISHVKSRKHHTSVQWLCNPISKEVYGLQETTFNQVHSNIQSIIGKSFDLLFICKSANWLPPHLDSAFQDFCHNVLSIVKSAYVEPNLLKPREIQDIIQPLQTQCKQVKQKGGIHS